MDCRQCNDDLTAYLDGELENPFAERMSRHLEICPPCRAECMDLRDSAALVAAHARQLEPAPELWNNLRARVAEMPAPGGSPGLFRFLVVNRWAAALTTLAATAALAVGLWGYLQHKQGDIALETDFNQYVQSRMVTEQLHGIQLMEAQNAPLDGEFLGPVTLENPFAGARQVSFTNPFRSENR
jgi:anti-sigma factor RsiW